MSRLDLHEVKARLGGTVYAGGRRWSGPGPGHSRSDRSLSVLLTDDGRALVHSFAGDPFAACAAFLGIEASKARPLDLATRERLERCRAAERQRERNRVAAFCEAIWRASEPLEGSPGARYLAARAIGWFPADVRFHPAAPRGYVTRETAPAVIALARSVTGAPKAVQATFLTPDGRARTGRATFGAIVGAAVRLAPPGPCLTVAEGLETAASFGELEGVATWATLGTANLAAFTPPACVRHLTIAASGDPVVTAAARFLAQRMRARCAVTIMQALDGPDRRDLAERARAMGLLDG